MYSGVFTIGQIFGLLILGGTVLVPGLGLAGFHGGTSWSILGWVCVSIVGGFFGGMLLAPKHRIAGAIGGMIGAPLGLLALYFYARNRLTIYRIEASVVSMVGALPGFIAFFILRVLTDLIFPAKPADDDDYDDEDDEDEDDRRPSRGRKRIVDDDDEDEDDEEDEDEDDEDEEDDDDRRRRTKRKRFRPGD